ncbi:alpha-parvin-like [Petromyzon marinus]|uniref:alpha-parvin-like n=1 Tax=Petromyzon marinus TaxID=7757 RepID=UPI003F6FDE41
MATSLNVSDLMKDLQLDEDCDLDENETTLVIQPNAYRDEQFLQLSEVLLDWVNCTLREENVKVRSVKDDFFDGLVLQHLLEKLGRVKLAVPEIALSEEIQTHKLNLILQNLDKQLCAQDPSKVKWTVKSIHSKNTLATMHLLIRMVQHFSPKVLLPHGVSVKAYLLEKGKNTLKAEQVMEELTPNQLQVERGCPSSDNPIDVIFRVSPEKVPQVEQMLLAFANGHLAGLHLDITDLVTQFADGVMLVLLLGQLSGYFVPLHSYYLSPESREQKVHNVKLALELMEDDGNPMSPVQPEEIVDVDAKAAMKILYILYNKHKASSIASQPQSS